MKLQKQSTTVPLGRAESRARKVTDSILLDLGRLSTESDLAEVALQMLGRRGCCMGDDAQTTIASLLLGAFMALLEDLRTGRSLGGPH